MNGIFNYQVPGRATSQQSAQTHCNAAKPRACDKSTLPTSHPDRLQPLNQKISTLLQNLLQKTEGNGTATAGSGNTYGSGTTTHTKPPVSTKALGEEDGGGMPPPNHANNPPSKPDITTLAVGEEDGGNMPPPDVTTLAVGEEDGSLNPPPDVTTLAVGEEDGGAGTC